MVTWRSNLPLSLNTNSWEGVAGPVGSNVDTYTLPSSPTVRPSILGAPSGNTAKVWTLPRSHAPAGVTVQHAVTRLAHANGNKISRSVRLFIALPLGSRTAVARRRERRVPSRTVQSH